MSSSAPSTSFRPPPLKLPAQLNVHSTPTEFSPSSPVKEKFAKHFAEQNRYEVQWFAYDEDIIQLEYTEHTAFFEFLNIPQDRLLKIPKLNGPPNLDTFVKVANAMAKSVKDLRECLRYLLVC
jgi:hypothetical protein